MNASSELVGLVRKASERSVPDAIRQVGEALADQYAMSFQGILFYGSCLRMSSHQESLVDCYVLVNRYSAAFSFWWLTMLNRILPPNVFYREVPFEGQIVRVKYAVLTLEDFERSVSPQWFHSYFWGRFAQPTAILLASTTEVRERIVKGLETAVLTFFARVLPRLSSPFSAYDVWCQGLALSYGAELRSESSKRVQALWEGDTEYYEGIVKAVFPSYFPGSQVVESENGTSYVYEITKWRRAINKVGWIVRRLQGKILSVLRLIKAAYTFQGGADYLIWKIERHSGVKIELTPRQRRHPILSGLLAFWRLYRQGAFR